MRELPPHSLNTSTPLRMSICCRRPRNDIPSRDVPSLPGSLDESLKALENDHDFLLKGDVFSPQLIERWIRYKHEKEIDALRLRPHPLEFALYFDV